MLTYEQGVAPFRNTDRLSDSDRSKLMGAGRLVGHIFIHKGNDSGFVAERE